MSAKAFVFARFLADFGKVTASPCCVSPANSKAVGTLFLLGIMRVASNGIGRNSRRFLCETAVGSGTASTPIACIRNYVERRAVDEMARKPGRDGEGHRHGVSSSKSRGA